MFILDNIVSACSDPALANSLRLIKNAFTLIQVIGPIIALVSLVLILIKLFINPENKKLKNAFRNWLIALLFLFFIPIIVNAVMGLLDDSFSVSSCWNYAEQVKNNGTESEYIDPNNKKPSNPILDTDE